MRADTDTDSHRFVHYMRLAWQHLHDDSRIESCSFEFYVVMQLHAITTTKTKRREK